MKDRAYLLAKVYTSTKSIKVMHAGKILEYVTHQQEQSYTIIPHQITYG